MISEKPSLYLKPEAYKADVLYCQLPEGSIGNMTFARTSIATRVDKDGLVNEVATGIPRLDYPLINGVAQSCPDLLLEPTRTNICLRSEEFDNVSWVDNSQMTVTSNINVSPDGTKTADKIVYADNATDGTVTQNITVADATDYELSIWMKGRVGGEKVRIDFSSTTAGTNGTERTLTTEWVRYTENLLSDATARGFSIRCLTSSGNQTFYVWGAQMELSDYRTTYIKTTTVSVTRATEELNTGGDSTTFNSAEGVLYCEISALFDDLTRRVISISDGTNDNTFYISYDTTTNQVTAFVNVGAVPQATINSTQTITDVLKIAFKYKVNDFALWINGVEVGTDTSGSVPSASTIDVFDIQRGDTANKFYGKIKDARVYKTALDDNSLKELTE